MPAKRESRKRTAHSAGLEPPPFPKRVESTYVSSLSTEALVVAIQEEVRPSWPKEEAESLASEAEALVAHIGRQRWSGEDWLASLNTATGSGFLYSDALRGKLEEYCGERDVFCRFNVFDIEEIDQSRRVIVAKFYIELAWEDVSLRGAAYGNLDATQIEALSYKPHPILTNLVGEREELKAPWLEHPENYSGKFGMDMACWRAVLRGAFSQKFDFHAFPFDAQRLELTLELSAPGMRLRENPHFPSDMAADFSSTWRGNRPCNLRFAIRRIGTLRRRFLDARRGTAHSFHLYYG